MAIKALKQSVSISETQKMIHQWKAKGITDSATLKLLDLYLGLTPYMTAEGIYPMRNLYQICQSMKTTHTTTLLENIRKCCSFGLIWNENRTHLLGFYSPLWCDGLKIPPRKQPILLPNLQFLLPVRQLQLQIKQLRIIVYYIILII